MRILVLLLFFLLHNLHGFSYPSANLHVSEYNTIQPAQKRIMAKQLTESNEQLPAVNKRGTGGSHGGGHSSSHGGGYSHGEGGHTRSSPFTNMVPIYAAGAGGAAARNRQHHNGGVGGATIGIFNLPCIVLVAFIFNCMT